MSTIAARRIDTAHHHPRVRRATVGWAWECSCGGASRRSGSPTSSWRLVVISALNHSESLSA